MIFGIYMVHSEAPRIEPMARRPNPALHRFGNPVGNESSDGSHATVQASPRTSFLTFIAGVDLSVLNHYLAPEFVRAEGALVADFLVTTLQLADASGDTIVNL